MSWVTLDRICQERVDKEGVRLRVRAQRQREEVQEMLRFPRRGEVGVTEETTAFANARIFDGSVG